MYNIIELWSQYLQDICVKPENLDEILSLYC